MFQSSSTTPAKIPSGRWLADRAAGAFGRWLGRLSMVGMLLAMSAGLEPAAVTPAIAATVNPSTANYPLTASIYSKTNENLDAGKVQISQYNLYVSDMTWWGLLCGGTSNCNTPNAATTTVGQYLKQLNPEQTDVMYQHSVFMEKGGWGAPSDGRGFIINGTPYYVDLRWFLTYAGSNLTSNIDSQTTSIPVNDLSRFAIGDNVIVGGPSGQSTPEMMLVNGMSGSSGRGTLSVTRAQFSQNGKFPAVSHNANDFVRTIVHAFGAQDFLAMNMSSQAPSTNINPSFGSQTWNRFLASFWQAKMANDAKYSNLDGLFLDNVVSSQEQILDNFSQVDYSNTNAATPVATGDVYFSEGMTDLATQIRTRLGTGKIVMANTGGSSSVNGSQLNGGMIEGTDQNWKNCLIGGDVTSTYNGWIADAVAPQTFINNGSATVSTPEFDYQAMRFELAMTLANNGYFAFDEFLAGGNSSCGLNSGGHQTAWWYDEFDNAGKQKGYLGQPLAAVTQPLPGVYRRDFQNGIALANNTSSPQTVSLGGQYTRLTASGRCPGSESSCATPQTAANTGNNGSTVSSITLQPQDGIILLGSPTVKSAVPSMPSTSQGIVTSFEDGGLDSWAAGGASGVASVRNSTTAASNGTHSLAVSLTNSSRTNWGAAYLLNPAWLAPGRTVSAQVKVPLTAPVRLLASIFVQGQGTPSTWNEGSPVKLTPGTWMTVTYSLPSDVVLSKPVSVGVRFYPSSTSGTWSGTAYIDTVSYR